MTSNFNTNQRTREYSYNTRTIDNYPIHNMNSINYDSDNAWPDNGFLSPRLSENRRLDTVSLRSSNQNYDSAKSKDEFAIFGSSIRQKSEKINMERTDGARVGSRQVSNFNTLPVKNELSCSIPSSEDTQMIKSETVSRQQSQPKYTPNTDAFPDSLFDLILTQGSSNNAPYLNNQRVELENTPRVEVPVETIVPQRKAQIESSYQPNFAENDINLKDEEISRLNKNVERMAKKVSILEKNNCEYQERLKNLLKERKDILKQIESSEFEEIIEEEEVQKAKPNFAPRENVTRLEYIKQEAPKPVEVSHTNCLQRGRITLDDVPQKMLESFRTDILKQEKERTEMEKRSLVEALKIQQQKQLQSMQAEYEAKQLAIENVSVKSYKKTVFNQKVSESNLRRTPSPKSTSRSVGISVYPPLTSTPSQSEINQPRSALNKYMAKTALSKYQKSIIDRVMNSVDGNNYDQLIKIFEEVLCRPSTSVGINSTAPSSTKATNTNQVDIVDVTVEVNTVTELVQPKVTQKSCGSLAKPVLIQRGCQPEDIFKFDSGTSTDQKFSRSQGVMTTGDYNGYRSPSNLEIDSVINKTNNRVESHKQTISHSVYMTSPTKEFVDNREKSLSPKVIKVTQQVPETVIEHVVEVKRVKNEAAPKPKPINVVEEVKHTVEERTEQVTTVLDQNRVPKQEIPTTIECWETLSKIKDGEVIEKTETYHDKIVSTDIEKIKEHLDQHDSCHSNEVSPITKPNSVYFRTTSQTLNPKVGSESFKSPTIIEDMDIKDKNIIDTALNFKDIKSKFEGIKSSPNESVPVKVSSDIKVTDSLISKSFGNKNVSVSRESGDISHSTKLKKPVETNEIKFQLKKTSPPPRETYHESVSTVSSGSIKKSTENKEIKVQKNVTTESPRRDSSNIIKNVTVAKEVEVKQRLPIKETYHEFEKTISMSNTKNATDIRDTKVQPSFAAIPIKDTSRRDLEPKFGSSIIKKKEEAKEIEVSKKAPAIPPKDGYRLSEEIISYSSLIKPVEIKEISSKKEASPPLRKVSDEISSDTKNLVEIKETQRRYDFTSPSVNETRHESERISSSNSLQNTVERNKKDVQQHVSSIQPNEIFEESEVRFSSLNFKNPIELRESDIHQRIPFGTHSETSYQEIEHTIKTTTTSSTIPIAIETINSSVNIVKPTSITVKTSNANNSIGSLISPPSFQSYSSSKPRSIFSSSRTESYSFESQERHLESPPRVQFGQTVPINVSSFESTSKATRIPVNVTGNRAGSSSIASSNSAFHSLSSSNDVERAVEVPVTIGTFKTEYSETPIPENINQNCQQLFVWLKNVSTITISTIDHLPPQLVTVSSTLIDWWVDITVNAQSVQLSAIVNSLTSTFNKNLLKYLIVTVDQQGNSCLHYIIGNLMWDNFNVLSDTNLIDPNIFNTKGYTVLMVASTIKITSDNALSSIRKLASGANFNLKSKFQGQTAICIAALHDNSETIQILYTMGADINIRDNNDNTPLMIACQNNNIDAVKTLMLLPGLSVDITNKDGKSAIDIAQESQFKGLVELFNQRKITKSSEVSGFTRVTQSNSSFSGMSLGSRKY